jgi:hypothetical protein
MTDSFYRVHVGCLLGRDISKEYANADAHEERDIDRPCWYARRHTEGCYGSAGGNAHEDTQQTTCDADEYRLYQKL